VQSLRKSFCQRPIYQPLTLNPAQADKPLRYNYKIKMSLAGTVIARMAFVLSAFIYELYFPRAQILLDRGSDQLLDAHRYNYSLPAIVLLEVTL
jgi:hypothetical protein